MRIEFFLDTIEGLRNATVPAELEEINRLLSTLGWAPVDTVAFPASRNWRGDNLTLEVVKVGGNWVLDVVFSTTELGDPDEVGPEELESAVADKFPEMESIATALTNLRGAASVVDSAIDRDFDYSEFVHHSVFRVDGLTITAGISNVDVEMPVIVMARVE